MKKTVAMALVLSLALSLTACQADKAPDPTAENSPASASYTATEQGYGGEVTVTLTITDDQLTDVVVTGEKETPSIGGMAVEQLPGDMMAANSVEVDGVSGATVSSTAILKAAAAALAQSGVTLAPREDASGAPTYEDTTAGVVVVGGGIAGMSAAMVLADAGKDVILLEKTALLGGAATVSHSAMWAVGNQLTDTQFTADEVYEFINSHAGPVNNKTVFYALADESYRSLEFLMDNGVNFTDGSPCNPQADSRFWFVTSENFGAGMMAALGESYEKRDIDTRMQTEAVELLCDTTGAVTGVVALCDGQRYTISAQQVILATGGYGHNEELLAQYSEGYENVVVNLTVAGATGDGHRMGTAVGGHIVGEGSMGSGSSVESMQPDIYGDALLVNINGEKVGPANEHYTKLYLDVLESPNGETYSIYPADIDKYSKGGRLENMEKEYQAGNLYKADTVEELARQMGIHTETLLNTVAVHNAHCAAGESDEFNTPVEWMAPIENGPFYGMVHRAASIGTIAGLAVNENMELLRADGSVVPNVYAVGELIFGNWFNGSYPMSGTGLGGCVSSGRIAADVILGR